MAVGGGHVGVAMLLTALLRGALPALVVGGCVLLLSWLLLLRDV